MDGSIGYLNPGTTFYAIDTTKLPKGEKAWDMENNMYQNGYKVRRMPSETVFRLAGFSGRPKGKSLCLSAPLREINPAKKLPWKNS